MAFAESVPTSSMAAIDRKAFVNRVDDEIDIARRKAFAQPRAKARLDRGAGRQRRLDVVRNAARRGPVAFR